MLPPHSNGTSKKSYDPFSTNGGRKTGYQASKFLNRDFSSVFQRDGHFAKFAHVGPSRSETMHHELFLRPGTKSRGDPPSKNTPTCHHEGRTTPTAAHFCHETPPGTPPVVLVVFCDCCPRSSDSESFSLAMTNWRHVSVSRRFGLTVGVGITSMVPTHWSHDAWTTFEVPFFFLLRATMAQNGDSMEFPV